MNSVNECWMSRFIIFKCYLDDEDRVVCLKDFSI